MPRLIIQGRDHEVVYDGEGELLMEPGPTGSRLPGRVSIHQEEIRPTEHRGRELDITEFLRMAPAEYTIQYRVPPPPEFHWDPEVTVTVVPPWRRSRTTRWTTAGSTPGDTGTSRWTPPDDPEEKIRSCP